MNILCAPCAYHSVMIRAANAVKSMHMKMVETSLICVLHGAWLDNDCDSGRDVFGILPGISPPGVMGIYGLVRYAYTASNELS